MPEVVVEFMKNKDFNAVQQTQDKILLDYMDDITSHAKGAEKIKVKACYDSIPRQLARRIRNSSILKWKRNRLHASMRTVCNGCAIPIWFIFAIT